MTLLTIAGNDLRLTVRDKMFFFWFLIFPLLFALVFGIAFKDSSQDDQKVALDIIDRDESFLSRQLIKELESEKYALRVLDEIQENGIRTLIIPDEFSTKIMAGEKVELVLRKKANSDVGAGQAATSHLFKAVINIISGVIHTGAENESGLEENFLKSKPERLITLDVQTAGIYKILPSGFNRSIPSISVMFILFTLFMYGGILLLQERRNGQLERLALTPASMASIIGGKWLSRLILGMAQISILFVVGKFLFKAHYGNSLTGIFLVALSFTATIAGISLFLGSVFRKEEVLVVFNILAANLMSALGGCWFPQEFIPPGLKAVGMVFPTGWAMDAFHQLIFLGSGISAIRLHLGVLSLYTIVFLIIAVRFFKLR